MNTETFWQIIEETRRGNEGNCEGQIEALHTYLLTLPSKEVESFGDWFFHFLNHAYSHRLWNALGTYVYAPSDDGFEYFRAWLVIQGRAIYQQVIRRPSSIQELFPEWRETFQVPGCEMVEYVADQVVEEQTGVHPGRERNKAFLRELGVSLEES